MVHHASPYPCSDCGIPLSPADVHLQMNHLVKCERFIPAHHYLKTEAHLFLAPLYPPHGILGLVELAPTSVECQLVGKVTIRARFFDLAISFQTAELPY